MNKLKFDQSSVKIIFESGAESFYYETKEEAFDAVKDCLEKGKISKKDFKRFVEEIAESELPSFVEELVIVTASVIASFIDALGEEFKERKKDFKVPNPYFEMCDCGRMPPHGYFYDEEGDRISMGISSKDEAHIFIDTLENAEVITPGDASGLRVSVDLIQGFVENPLMN
ncbi:MAG: hypothetical protein MRY57_01310 [Candidatus Pacebacteria bacterium]|nr:hypothetical protein [Candidatus Paceibacterota bacterium]